MGMGPLGSQRVFLEAIGRSPSRRTNNVLAAQNVHTQPHENIELDEQAQIGCWFKWQIGFNARHWRSWSRWVAASAVLPLKLA